MENEIVKLKPRRLRQNLIEYGFATILIALVVWFVVKKNMTETNQEVKDEVMKTNTNIGQLQAQIDTVKLYQNLLIEKAYQLEASQQETMQLVERSNTLLLQNKQAIEKIRARNNESINRASSYNYKQLDSFFSSRFNNKGY